ALGSFYLIHNTLTAVKLWDFEGEQFIPVNGKEIFSGNIESITTKEKAKFPQDFFPERQCKWSRKGFIRTRWKVKDCLFDLINIHLFHDASNFLSIESFPSPYTKSRQHALKYTLDRFANDAFDKVPFFIFGDFNFRLDTGGVIKKLTKNCSPLHIKSAKNGETEKLVYKDPCGNSPLLLTLEKKVFDFQNQELFCEEENFKWLLDFDRELEDFRNDIFEYMISFPPSYPFTEDSENSRYMKTRCPAWCDRVLLSQSAKNLINNVCDYRLIVNLFCCIQEKDTNNSVIYQMIGRSVPMGDHKPVFLWFQLDTKSVINNSPRIVTVLDMPARKYCNGANLKQFDRITLKINRLEEIDIFGEYKTEFVLNLKEIIRRDYLINRI
ncbi:type I inositol 1:4:5-trisphosphate 5-phosphatase-like protein, partial [Leptotrombidium deliense]